MRLIDADYIVNVAERAHEQWSLAMVGADDTRKVNEVFKKQYLCKVVKAIADDAPTIEAEPVRHGRWDALRKGDWTSVFECSECHRRVTVAGDKDMVDVRVNKKYPYCHCGAKMDGDFE